MEQNLLKMWGRMQNFLGKYRPLYEAFDELII